MTERRLRYVSGIALIAMHLIILVSAILIKLMHGFDKSEFTTVVGIVAPMFSGYTSAILAFIIRDRHVTIDRSKRVTGTYALLIIVFPLILATIVCASMWMEAFSKGFENFDDFKTLLLALESAFAIYVSLLVYSLFDKKSDSKSNTSHGGADPSRDYRF
jgi:hypothetical protein